MSAANRIDARFAQLRASGRKALIPFMTAGDPLPEATADVMHGLVDGGADLIELGVPFSDPMADGPVIQKASERAISRGVRLTDVLDTVQQFRTRDSVTPVVLMGYLNPVEIHGRERFAADAAGAGVDGVLLVDSPVEESAALRPLLASHGMHQILLAAPTTSPERQRQLAQAAGGFLYYVAFAGVTGAAHLDVADVAVHVDALRRLAEVPVAVGFGVRDAASARAVAQHADAVVVGSALVEHLSGCADAETAAADAAAFMRGLRAAIDGTDG
jgi:tryptophan synthase alpha chain